MKEVAPSACTLPMRARIQCPLSLMLMDVGVIVKGSIWSTSLEERKQRFCVHLEIVTGLSEELDELVNASLCEFAGAKYERRGLTVFTHHPASSYEHAAYVLRHEAMDLVHKIGMMERKRIAWLTRT